jgi:uracil-DNA glycosylase family 4
MAAEFHQLLDSTIAHLESLRADGKQFVPLEADTMRALNAGIAAVPKSPGVGAPASSPARSSQPPAPSRPVVQAVPATPPARVITEVRAASPEKIQAIAELRERAMQCMKCANLAATRTNVVFGVGNIDADLMFVGEAPGADEDAAGEPFVGAAGQLLTKMIAAMGLTRDQVYIGNILKCRPDMPAGSSGNRKPTPEEMQTCIPYLHAQIDLIQPKVLVGLGGTAIEGLLGKSGITKLRGQWHTYRGIPLMPTYHPAYLLRNQSNAEKRRVWEDLMAVMEKLGLPISEKQRGYFARS